MKKKKTLLSISVICVLLLFFLHLELEGKNKVKTLPATNVSSTGATLNASVEPDGCGGSVNFYYCEASACTSTTSIVKGETLKSSATATRTISTTVTELKANTQYKYQALSGSSCDSFGNDYGEWVTFTTLTGSITVVPIPGVTLAPLSTTPPGGSLAPQPTLVVPSGTPPPGGVVPPSGMSGEGLGIQGNVPGFGVIINGIFRGTAPESGFIFLPLPPGDYQIVLEKEGCSPVTASATVLAGKPLGITIFMECSMPQPPLQPTEFPPPLQPGQPELPPPQPPSEGTRNMTLYIGMGVLGILLVVLIIIVVAMMSRRGKRPPRIYTR